MLILIDLGEGKNRLGGSCLAQVYSRSLGQPADLENPFCLTDFFNAVTELKFLDKIMAYHDRSDGGLFATLSEMAFAGNMGVNIDLKTASKEESISLLFAEEAGAVIQVNASDLDLVMEILGKYSLDQSAVVIGEPTPSKQIKIQTNHDYTETFELRALREMWSELSFRMQSIRDNPESAKEAFNALLDDNDPGLSSTITFSQPHQEDLIKFKDQRPKVAVLREQGVNSHVEMAVAFHRAGFEAIDVHMTDIISGRISLDDFKGLVACGGFSYGDVLGAGGGWAKSILFNPYVRNMFEAFFNRSDTFTLGVCNGCHLLRIYQNNLKLG